MIKGSNLKKVVIGTVAAIGTCTLSFSGLTQSVKAEVVNKTKIIPTAYSSSVSKVKKSVVPLGYVKATYNVEIGEYSEKPTAKDMSAEEAAELGAQNLWKIFGVDLSGKTIEMTYSAATSDQPRAQWEGIITIDENLLYSFTVDSVTGEHRSTSQSRYWTGNINVGMDMDLVKDSSKYIALAKEAAKKYQLVSGQVVSAEYSSQSYISNDIGKNPGISIIVKSDNGQEAQLTFSRYNQELLSVEFDSWVKEAKILEEKIEKELREKAANHIDETEQQDTGNYMLKKLEEK
ncbi:hypothetical protein CLPU_4c01280 [Gottschalkia purinilytica]|uniref:Uncharacterized protein n=1 Tax=Gottschalkia purinilytica TaxID=1503 RepID=A0A0L0WC89_GOTPU|nr:hypothetical protein [Gottschalkia purinilytica]KNF09082.1 hypothetical protein CLPU_4c01280 [Gottschalkia purinilytica]